jgi:5-methylcytosine-specific restriction protein A
MVKSGRCPAHQAKRWQNQDQFRGSASSRGYDSVWRRLRKMQLAREPLCRECAKTQRITSAAEVDHVIPIRQGGARLDAANLQSLCRSCHSRKTLRESVTR